MRTVSLIRDFCCLLNSEQGTAAIPFNYAVAVFYRQTTLWLQDELMHRHSGAQFVGGICT